MRKRSNERTVWMEGEGREQGDGRKRESSTDTQLVSWYRHTFTLYLQCIQRAQTSFINPVERVSSDIRAFPTSYSFDVQPEAARLVLYLPIDCWCDATRYVYIYISLLLFFFPPLRFHFHFHFLRRSSSPPTLRAFLLSLFRIPFHFPISPPTNDGFASPSFAHSFPTSYEFAFDDIVLEPLATRSPIKIQDLFQGIMRALSGIVPDAEVGN